MTRVTSLAFRRSPGYVESVGDLPAMSEPLHRLHTDTGLVTAYAEWSVEAGEGETHSVWLLHPDGTRKRLAGGSPASGKTFLNFEAVSGLYTLEVLEGEAGPIIGSVTLDVDVGY